MTALPEAGVAGVDGCHGGWLAVWRSRAGGALRLHVSASVTDLTSCVVLALDVPMGLPSSGPRACDRAARSFLGRPRASSVFPAVAHLAMGHVVTVHVRAPDRYGRTVADVRLPDGRLLNKALVRAGYAWWFRRYSANPRLAAAEAEGRAARTGLWADPLPVPPWEWRATALTRRRPPPASEARPIGTR